MFDSLREDFANLREHYQEVQEKLEIVKDEADKAKKVGQSIQHSIEEFQVEAEPRVEVIKKVLDKYSEGPEKH